MSHAPPHSGAIACDATILLAATTATTGALGAEAGETRRRRVAEAVATRRDERP